MTATKKAPADFYANSDKMCWDESGLSFTCQEEQEFFVKRNSSRSNYTYILVPGRAVAGEEKNYIIASLHHNLAALCGGFPFKLAMKGWPQRYNNI